MLLFSGLRKFQSTHVRGRQAFLMIHKYLSMSQKHGGVYDIEDLMAVTLVNGDLRSFPIRWDAVIAGITFEPDVIWKPAYSHNAIKNFKPLSHDVAVHGPIREWEPNRSYEFLMKTVPGHRAEDLIFQEVPQCSRERRKTFLLLGCRLLFPRTGHGGGH